MNLLDFVVYGIPLLLLAAVAAAFIAASVRVYREYDRGVRFRLGRFSKVIGPGIGFVLPFIDSAVPVDTRSHLLEIPSLRVLTADHATAFIGICARYRISSPALAVTKAVDAKATLKSIIDSIARGQAGEVSFPDLVGKRAFINARLREAAAAEAAAYGISIEGVDVTHVTPSERTLALLNGNAINTRGQNRARPATGEAP